jgi:hypothetical protein
MPLWDLRSPSMYPYVTIGMSIVVFVSAAGCRPRCPTAANAATTGEARAYRLTWDNYDGFNEPDRAEYILDGVRVGRGREGFERVKAIVSAAPVGSILYLEWEDKLQLERNSGPGYHVPFASYGHGFNSLIEKNGLEVRWPAGYMFH